MIGVLGFDDETPQLHWLRINEVGSVEIDEVYLRMGDFVMLLWGLMAVCMSRRATAMEEETVVKELLSCVLGLQNRFICNFKL